MFKFKRSFLLLTFLAVFLVHSLGVGFSVFQSTKTAYAQTGAATTDDEEIKSVPCYDPPNIPGGSIVKGIISVGTLGIVDGGSVVEGTENAAGIAKDPLKWFSCAVSEMLAKSINFINLVVSRLMIFDPTKEEEAAKTAYNADCSSSTTGDEECANAAGINADGLTNLRRVWTNILRLSNILILLGFLIMILSTALDLNIFSAYTIKKLLPRILLAAIAANLSWVICSATITGVNYVGIGIQAVMIQPFQKDVVTGLDAAVKENTTESAVSSEFQGAVLLGIGGVAFAMLAGAGWILLPVLAGMFVAIVIGLVVILLRRILLIVMLIISPLAFAAWALPGGDKWLQKWWKSFVQTLMIFPYAMILFGSGVILASVLSAGGGMNLIKDGNSNIEKTINGFLMLIVLVLPYALLPTAFKAISGVLGTLTGMINDKSKGIIDRSKNLRNKKISENMDNLKAGNRFKGGRTHADGTPSNLRGRLNRGLQTGSLLGKTGFRPGEMRGNIRSARNTADIRAAKEFAEKNETFRGFAADDDKLWAMQIGGGDIEQIKAVLKKRAPGRFNDPNTLNSAAAEVSRAYRESGGRAGLLAATMAQAGTGTGFNYSDNGNYEDDMYNSIIRAAGGDRNMAGMLLGEMRPALKNSGRMEFSGGYANQAVILGKRMDAEANGGFIYDDDGNAIKYDEAQAMRDTARDAYNSNAGAFIAGKKQTVKMFAPMVTEDIRASATAGPESFIREIANAAGKGDAAAAVAPQNAEEWYRGVTRQEIDVATMHPEVRQALDRAITARDKDGNAVSSRRTITVQEAQEALKSNPVYQGTRKEFERISLAGAEQAQMEAAMREQAERAASGDLGPPGVPGVR